MNEPEANAVLMRFSRVIDRVARRLARSFPSVTEFDDARQDASILVLVYAGMAESFGGLGHHNTLPRIEKAGSTESRIQGILATQLRLDLSRYYGRKAHKHISTVPLHNVPEAIAHNTDLDSELETQQDYALWLKLEFPLLSMWLVDGKSQDQIAVELGVSRSTINNRIAAEKESAAHSIMDDAIAELAERMFS